jgi:hypothetical protein
MLTTVVNDVCNNVVSKFSGTGGADVAALLKGAFELELDLVLTPLSGGGPKVEEALMRRYLICILSLHVFIRLYVPLLLQRCCTVYLSVYRRQLVSSITAQWMWLTAIAPLDTVSIVRCSMYFL